jgi:hypothetical protein
MEGWIIALILKPIAALGLLRLSAKIHGFLFRVMPAGRIKTALLRER